MTATLPTLDELAAFAGLHAKAQGIDAATTATALVRIAADGDGEAWPRAWSELGDAALARDPLGACRRYVLARFPFPADDARRVAAAKAVDAFDSWRSGRGIERAEFALPCGDVAAWTANVGGGRPLLVVCGGIISVKEQWAPFLGAARRLGVGVLVTEMPSVGENRAVYGPDSTDFFPQLLDALGAEVCAPGVHVVALSFAGHLALAAARGDSRISSVHTVGAPVSSVFTEPAKLPLTTLSTLDYLSGGADLAPMALTDLSGIGVPVRYVASARDEIIPRREWELLAEGLPDFTWVEFDDVHGSPHHLADTRLWLLSGVLAAMGDRRAKALDLVLRLRGRTGRGGTTRTKG